MMGVIKGAKYKFVVNFFRCENIFSFDIEAIDLQNRTHSFINNLNCVLSEFDIDVDNEKVSDSQWSVKEREGKTYFQKAIYFISDKTFRKYLEKQLTLDQEISGWTKI